MNKFNNLVESVLNESTFNYKNMKQVEADSDKIIAYIMTKTDNFQVDDAVSNAEPGSFKVKISQEVESNAKQPKFGQIRGRRNQGKSKPCIVVQYYDTFWKNYRELGGFFFKITDFNDWLNTL